MGALSDSACASTNNRHLSGLSDADLQLMIHVMRCTMKFAVLLCAGCRPSLEGWPEETRLCLPISLDWHNWGEGIPTAALQRRLAECGEQWCKCKRVCAYVSWGAERSVHSTIFYCIRHSRLYLLYIRQWKLRSSASRDPVQLLYQRAGKNLLSSLPSTAFLEGSKLSQTLNSYLQALFKLVYKTAIFGLLTALFCRSRSHLSKALP